MPTVTIDVSSEEETTIIVRRNKGTVRSEGAATPPPRRKPPSADVVGAEATRREDMKSSGADSDVDDDEFQAQQQARLQKWQVIDGSGSAHDELEAQKQARLQKWQAIHGTPQSSSPWKKKDLNEATMAELMRVNDIGKKTAEAVKAKKWDNWEQVYQCIQRNRVDALREHFSLPNVFDQ